MLEILEPKAASTGSSSLNDNEKSLGKRKYHEIILENPKVEDLMNRARLDLHMGVPATRVVPKYARELRPYAAREWISRVMRNALGDLFGPKCRQLDRCMPLEYKRPKSPISYQNWQGDSSLIDKEKYINVPTTPSQEKESADGDGGSRMGGMFRDILNRKPVSSFWF